MQGHSCGCFSYPMTRAPPALGIPVYSFFLTCDCGRFFHSKTIDNHFFIYILLLFFSIICLIFLPIDFSSFSSIFFLGTLIEITSSLLPSLYFHSFLSYFNAFLCLKGKKQQHTTLPFSFKI